MFSPHGIPPGYYFISRPKAGGLFTHYGILEILNWGGPVRVFELHPTTCSWTSFDEFAQGQRVTLIDQKPLDASYEIMARIDQILTTRRPYNPIFNNCEHAATEAWSGERKSGQTKGWGWAAAAVVVVLIARR